MGLAHILFTIKHSIKKKLEQHRNQRKKGKNENSSESIL